MNTTIPSRSFSSSSKRIVLIVGAGASTALHPAFALGKGLLKDISERVTDKTEPSSPYLSKLLDKLGYDSSLRNNFASHLDEYMCTSESQSIDGFIDEISSYPEFAEVKERFVQIAKFAIMFHILGYEGELKKATANGLPSDAWIHELAKFIDEKVTLETSSGGYDLKIITFNYDRNIEHFLYNHDRFKNKKRNIKEYLENSLMHIYGKIGNLNWQSTQDYFEFGEENDRAKKIHDGKNAINLMYIERSKQTENVHQALQWIHDPNTTKIVGTFGFSFDLINYRLLSLQTLETSKNDIQVIANIYPSTGDKFKERRLMANKIRNVKHDVELTYLSCTDFLRHVLNNSD